MVIRVLNRIPMVEVPFSSRRVGLSRSSSPDYSIRSSLCLHTFPADGSKTADRYFIEKFGRGGEIRTHDPLRPRQVRYQAALRPDIYWYLHSKPLPHVAVLPGISNRG